jgi:Uma2 family endonuclease
MRLDYAMKSPPSTRIWTDDELMALDSKDGRKHELWHGKVVTMSPAGAGHGDIIVRLTAAVAAHVYEHRLGLVYDGQTGFRLSVDFCFCPDLSFVSQERTKLILPAKEKLFHGAPDLAVEVLSPSDSITKTEDKLNRLLAHGTRLAWMIDLKQKSVRVYREPGKFELLGEGRFLPGNSVLPGFRLAIARLFDDPALS